MGNLNRFGMATINVNDLTKSAPSIQLYPVKCIRCSVAAQPTAVRPQPRAAADAIRGEALSYPGSSFSKT